MQPDFRLLLWFCENFCGVYAKSAFIQVLTKLAGKVRPERRIMLKDRGETDGGSSRFSCWMRSYNKTVTVIKESQYQINSIADDARAEKARLTRELEKVREETLAIIDKVDAARQEEQRSRLYLMQVSRDFRRYNEEEIRQAYGRARDIQVRLIVLTEKEKNLRAKRDELERALKVFPAFVTAETLSTQVGVALEYLSGNLRNFLRH